MTGKRKHDHEHEHAREDEHQDTLDGEDDEEMQQLKAEVDAMAQRLTEYRESVPHLLTTVLTSHLAAQRPTPITPASATMLPPPAPVPVHHLIEGDDTNIQDKLRLFRQKARTNMAAMPRSLQRLQQSIHKLQHIRPSNLHLHPILHTHFS